MSNIMERLYLSICNGMHLVATSILNDISYEKAMKLLEEEYVSEIGERCNLLIIASMKGYKTLVSLLCYKYRVNLERTGTIRVDNTLVEGATPLWAAAANGELDIVKILVSAGADLNHSTTTQSSPVRAACFYGRLDIVTYLVEHGADVTLKNKFNSTCLMIAAYKGFLDIVDYLLSKDVDVDEVAHCGSSALHYAAECGHLTIVKILLIYGAKFFPNHHGITPLLAAAERTRGDVVYHFMDWIPVSRKEKIDAFELLGASFANDKENYNIETCYNLLQNAMIIRFEDPNDIIYKPTASINPAYGNRRECENLEELMSIRDNAEAIHMESLIIRERILGALNPDVAHAVVFRGAVYADQMKFEKCILLWLHAIHLQQLNSLPITKDLLRFSQAFSQMFCCKVPVETRDLKIVLKAALFEISRVKVRIEQQRTKDDAEMMMEELEYILIHTLYIIVIITKLMSESMHEDDVYELERLIHQIVRLEPTTKNGYTLLHLCVDSDTPVDSFHIDDVCRFPCSLTASLLIRLGADVNARDCYKNTPLHIIAGYNKPISDFMTLFTIIARLVEADAHPDVVNCYGKTPNDSATTGVADIVLRHVSTLSLKCVAAKVVVRHSLPYVGIVPKNLESFIEMHGVDACKNESAGGYSNYCEIGRCRDRAMDPS